MRVRGFIILSFLIFISFAVEAQNQTPVTNPEDKPVDMNNPTFIPMLKVGKCLQNKDTIPYVELSSIFVYPRLVLS